ncbi:MAG: bifunctional riboflavin kinase/FAD synthetase [Pseudomonadota bacterium]
MVEVVRGTINLKAKHRRAVVTIGNFDGVHLGHQKILERVRAKADELNVPTMLICFEPQPKEFFHAFNAPARLTRFREKVELLDQHGIDYVLCFKFDERTRSMSADSFVDVLVSGIQASALFVGDDFRFGADRGGDFALLSAKGDAHGFQVTDMFSLTQDDLRVSSTRIRECLQSGDFSEAESLLGHPYTIVGNVIHGRRLGRTIGVPTANILLHRYKAPISGVYAVEVTNVEPGKTLYGVANFGFRPTIEEETVVPVLEVHIFDFNENIYGQCVRVTFRNKIRDEKKFPGLDALKEAILNDMTVARRFFGLATE